MAQLLCCCFQKKFKDKKISVLKPQHAHHTVGPNEYVIQNVCITKREGNQYYGRILNKNLYGNESSDIHLNQQPQIVSHRRMKIYPTPQLNDGSVSRSDPKNQNTCKRHDGAKQVFNTNLSQSKSAFQSEPQEHANDKGSVNGKTGIKEPFPYKMKIGERKFTSLCYDRAPIELIEQVQKRVQERKQSSYETSVLTATNLGTENPFNSGYATESSDVQHSTQDDINSQWEINCLTSYNNSLTNDEDLDKFKNETTNDKDENYEQGTDNTESLHNMEQSEKVFKAKVLETCSKSPIITNGKYLKTIGNKKKTTTPQENLDNNSVYITEQCEREYSESPLVIENNPLVYTTDTTPNRERTKSIIPTSLNLFSKQKLIPRKVTEQSTDEDIFRGQKPMSQEKVEAQYINVGKDPRINDTHGNIVISDYLNQFSSMFVDNLKDPIPKDPLTRPKSFNIDVPQRPKNRNRSAVRNVQNKYLTPTPKNNKQFITVAKTTQPRISILSKSRKGLQYIPKREQDDSSSEDDEQSEGNVPMARSILKSKKSVPIRKGYNVYNAQVQTLQDRSFEEPQRKLAGYLTKATNPKQIYLASEKCDKILHDPPASKTFNEEYASVSKISQQISDDEMEDDETDIMYCYPTRKFLNDSASEVSSGSNKLRWKIVLKRANENL